jgi:hypothetical protein
MKAGGVFAYAKAIFCYSEKTAFVSDEKGSSATT